MSEFKREVRYTVIKHNQLTESQMQHLKGCVFGEGIPTVRAVVVESDWPEFEPVWKMIEDRVTGAPVEGGKAEYDALAAAMTNQTIDGVPREITEAMSYYFGRDEVANFKLYLRREFETREKGVNPSKQIAPSACLEPGKLLQRLIAAEPCLLEKIHYVSDEAGDYRNYKVEIFIPTFAKRPEPFEVAAANWVAATAGMVLPVVLPARKSAVETFTTYGLGECAGWNACLEAVEEAVRLEQVPAAQPQGEPVAWTYCPECGCEEIHHQQGRHKQCAECHQEWFSDLDYSDVVRGHLKKLKAERPAPVSVVLPERLQQVLKFLDGAENLDGHWFGEPHPSGRKYWWRAELRKAIDETNLFAKQQ